MISIRIGIPASNSTVERVPGLIQGVPRGEHRPISGADLLGEAEFLLERVETEHRLAITRPA